MHIAACSGTCLRECSMQVGNRCLYLSVSSTGAPDSGGSLRTSSTSAGVASGSSFHADCTLAATALRAATSFTAAATAVKFVPEACMRASSLSRCASKRWSHTRSHVTGVSMLHTWHTGCGACVLGAMAGMTTFGWTVMSKGLGETGTACANCAAVMDGLVLPTLC